VQLQLAFILGSSIGYAATPEEVLAQAHGAGKPIAAARSYAANSSALQYSSKASKYFFARQYDKCIAAAKESIRLEPHYPWPHIYLGLCYWRQESFKLAEEELSKGINTPNLSVNADVYVSRGECYIALGQLDKAIADFTSGLAKDPKSEQSLIRRAETYCQLKRFKDAMNDATRYVTMTREPKSYMFRGRIYLDSGDYKAAIEDFSSAIKLRPKVPEYYAMRAVAYEKIGRKDLAKADREKESHLDPMQADR
jgi:tetratricopeptide (TPR) repeat protein